MWFIGSPSSEEAEAAGLVQALIFFNERNLTSVVIEMNCLFVVNDSTIFPLPILIRCSFLSM